MGLLTRLFAQCIVLLALTQCAQCSTGKKKSEPEAKGEAKGDDTHIIAKPVANVYSMSNSDFADGAFDFSNVGHGQVPVGALSGLPGEKGKAKPPRKK